MFDELKEVNYFKEITDFKSLRPKLFNTSSSVTQPDRVFCANNAASKSIILSCIIFLCEKFKLNTTFQRIIVLRFLLVLFFVII